MTRPAQPGRGSLQPVTTCRGCQDREAPHTLKSGCLWWWAAQVDKSDHEPTYNPAEHTALCNEAGAGFCVDDCAGGSASGALNPFNPLHPRHRLSRHNSQSVRFISQSVVRDDLGCIQGCIIDSPHPGEDCLTTQPRCRHCDADLIGEGTSPVGWRHASGLYSCQQKVSYGHNAAHPDIPCEPGGPNPCKCTYAPDAP